jgi:hypothetical protein
LVQNEQNEKEKLAAKFGASSLKNEYIYMKKLEKLVSYFLINFIVNLIIILFLFRESRLKLSMAIMIVFRKGIFYLWNGKYYIYFHDLYYCIFTYLYYFIFIYRMKKGTLHDLVWKKELQLEYYGRVKILLSELVSCVHVCKLLLLLFLQ